jgi:hypothetical protein
MPVSVRTSQSFRIANFTLGLWLFVSTFLSPHTRAQAANEALVGLFVAVTALAGWAERSRTRLHLINAALGAWLLISVVAFPPLSVATAINTALVGALVFALALFPRPTEGEPGPV